MCKKIIAHTTIRTQMYHYYKQQPRFLSMNLKTLYAIQLLVNYNYNFEISQEINLNCVFDNVVTVVTI